jgi:hypothetical protein
VIKGKDSFLVYLLPIEMLNGWGKIDFIAGSSPRTHFPEKSPLKNCDFHPVIIENSEKVPQIVYQPFISRLFFDPYPIYLQ